MTQYRRKDLLPSDEIMAGAPGPTIARQGELGFQGGCLYLRRVEYEPRVAPDGVLDIGVEVANNCGPMFPPYGGDDCSQNGINGYRYQMRLVGPDGDVVDDVNNCLTRSNVAADPNVTQHNFSLPAPSEKGQYSFSIEMKMNSSDAFDDSVQEYFNVQEGANIRPDDPEDDGPVDIPWTQILIALGVLGGAAVLIPQTDDIIKAIK